MMRNLTGIRGLWVLPGLAALLLAFAGCAEFNDEPADGATMEADVASLQQQLGYTDSYTSDGTRIVSPPESGAQETVETLVIGAVVVNEQSTPYTADSMTSAAQDRLETDVLNSANFFTVVDLPTSADTVGFNLPPTSAGSWQVMGAGLRVNIDTLGELEDENDAITHYGFTDGFLSQGTAEKGVSLVMRRACLSDEPTFGCAQFDAEGDTVITGDVEVQAALILRTTSDEYVDLGSSLPTVSETTTVAGSSITFTLNFSEILGSASFPFSVRADDTISIGDSGSSISTTVEWAVETGLEKLLSSISPVPTTGDIIKLVTTHEEGWADGECTDFSYSDFGTDAINDPESFSADEQVWIADCLQVYTTVLEETVTYDFSTPPVSSN